MIYLRAGLYAEGTTDYDFLCPLIDRLLDALAAPLYPAQYLVAETLGIDAPEVRGRRADRIAHAIADHADICQLFVIHTDGAADPQGAREASVDPGIAAARAALPGREIIAVPCVPVREIEAWLLTDRDAFRTLLGSAFVPSLPARPEKETDPKATLRKILERGGWRRGPESIYATFSERVGLATLRTLPAFLSFEADLVVAIRQVARAQGVSR